MYHPRPQFHSLWICRVLVVAGNETFNNDSSWFFIVLYIFKCFILAVLPQPKLLGFGNPTMSLNLEWKKMGGKADVNQPDSTIVILFRCSIDLKNELGNHFLPSHKLAVNRVSFGDASYVGFKVYKLTAANFHFCECVFKKNVTWNLCMWAPMQPELNLCLPVSNY